MTNVNWLIVRKMSVDAVPNGGGVKDAIKFLTTPGKISEGARIARQFVETAIKAVREAADPNPWRYSSDEDIAGEIRRQIEGKP